MEPENNTHQNIPARTFQFHFCSISIAGFNVYTHRDKIKRTLGYEPQKFSLYEDLTIRENIRFDGGIYGMANSLIRRKTEELIEELDLSSTTHWLRTARSGWCKTLLLPSFMIRVSYFWINTACRFIQKYDARIMKDGN